MSRRGVGAIFSTLLVFFLAIGFETETLGEIGVHFGFWGRERFST
jgi:hypothetical protein